jgi:hypothetical protein
METPWSPVGLERKAAWVRKEEEAVGFGGEEGEGMEEMLREAMAEMRVLDEMVAR